MKKVHLLPNVITAFSLTCGLFIIFKMSQIAAGDVTPKLLMEMSAILILAAIADLLDGAVARAMKAESAFGGLFDSLSDAITFGVGPAVVILKTLSPPIGTDLSFFITTAAMIYTVCGVLRLVRFNVTSKAPVDTLDENKNSTFTGLPIPAAAAAAFSANLFLISPEFKNWFNLSELAHTWVLFAVLVMIGYFMVSRWKFPSLKNLHIRVGSFRVIICTVVAAVFLLYGVFTHFPVLFFILSWGYLLVALGLSIARMIAGKKAKSLEPYEIEAEDED